MEDYIFNHKEQKCNPIFIPENGITQDIVCELANNLCADNFVRVNGQNYTHISLPKFLYDMVSFPNINLAELYKKYEDELWKCVAQQSENLSKEESFLNSLKSHETTSM